jgi:hypothetical protein
MHATDIVAYTYNAEILCPSCTLVAMGANKTTSAIQVNTERVLDFCANTLGFDRSDESSVDSSEFPKVVFASQVNPWEEVNGSAMADDERCDVCGEPLI